ncbi:hypothetical protein BGZ70_003749 [Mortierella alpina]|uniref:Uncharacterized protein n=1 Tax=Mortierella alpina TaxID=64518 RepID=A0A9P6LVL0_MORAP|nr:hypothetical protein BGZ70_003749 [Mortierella alpina]
MTMVTASPSSQAAEALLSRARLLSSNAYERTRSATPTAFAEGEDLVSGSSSLHARTSSSPSLSPIALSTASLHQRHRSSFNDFIRDHNKRRSSVQRLSSGSASSTKAAAQSEHDGSSAASAGMNAVRDEKGSGSQDLQSAEGPVTPPAMTTVVVVEPSTNKLLSTLSSSSSSSTATPLTPSTSDQSSVDGRNTGAQTLAPSACPTPESPNDSSHILTISTRPRASTMESTTDNRENSPRTPLAEGVQPGFATSTLSPVDQHRKHRSEIGSSGSGLVLGILEVLRDGEKVSVPLQRTPSTPKLTFSGPSEPKTEPSQLDHASQPEQSTVSLVSAAPTSTAPTSPTHDTPAPLPASNPAAPVKGSLTVDTAFLNRKTRSESVSTQGSVESCPSPQAPSPSVKQGRRSSKLFGKLVPKFLQTSFSPSNTTSSPRSALPASSSPLSALTTRPGRSASFAGGSSSSMVAGKGLSSGIGSIAEETTDKASALPRLPLTLPSLPASVLESDEDWLSPSSSKIQESVHTAPPATPSTCDPTLNKALEHTTASPIQEQRMQQPIFDYKVEVDYGHEPESEKEESTQEQGNVDGHGFSNGMSTTHEREEPASSPYTIDENCDDDFFLNSVLRKKSRPQSPPMLSTGSEAWSAGRTPSLSNSSSSSGSPSPTSPMAPTFGYASTPLSASPVVHSLQYHHYQQQQQQQPHRSNTYPSSHIHPGMDEKRSRLRDAVGEWRRSANASSGSMHSASGSYSSPTVPALAL